MEQLDSRNHRDKSHWGGDEEASGYIMQRLKICTKKDHMTRPAGSRSGQAESQPRSIWCRLQDCALLCPSFLPTNRKREKSNQVGFEIGSVCELEFRNRTIGSRKNLKHLRATADFPPEGAAGPA